MDQKYDPKWQTELKMTSIIFSIHRKSTGRFYTSYIDTIDHYYH